MSKFVVVKEAPETLRKEEYVISMPTFLDEIRAKAVQAPRNGLTGVNHLRSVVGLIGEKYDPNLTAWVIRPTAFEGRKFDNEDELSAIIVEMLQAQYPSIFDSYLVEQVKKRPLGTKLVYFVGPFQKTMAFTMNGLDQLDEKDIDVFLGLKPKKVVGKPAVTNDNKGSDGDEGN